MSAAMDPARTLRLVHGALLTGSLLFAGVVVWLTQQDLVEAQPGLEILQWAAAGFAVVAIGPALVLRSLLARAARANPSPEAVLRAGLVPAAVLEGAILFNLVAWLLTDSQVPNAVAALLPFLASCAMWAFGPPADDDARTRR